MTTKGQNQFGQETEDIRIGNIDSNKLGQSNPTYLLIDSSGFKAVLRTKPPGALISSKAHAIDREYRILKTLKSKSKIPVPLVYHYSQDTELIGSPFYVMEFLEGRIIADPSLPTVIEADAANYYKEIITVLGALHSLDYKSIGLGDYGPSSDYYPRQLKTLLRISKIQGSVKDDNGVEVGDLPYLNENMKWLFANLPEDEIAIVHGDYKNDNIVFHSQDCKIIGLLDWELSTIGHPLSDLANLLLPFYVPQNGTMIIMASMSVKRPLRVPTPNLAVITQGIAARVRRNQSSSAYASQVATLFKPCSEMVRAISLEPKL